MTRLDLTRPLSAAALERAGACPDQVAQVREVYGNGEHVLTRALLRDAAARGLTVGWLARHLHSAAWALWDADMATERARYWWGPDRLMHLAGLNAHAAAALADALGLPQGDGAP